MRDAIDELLFPESVCTVRVIAIVWTSFTMIGCVLFNITTPFCWLRPDPIEAISLLLDVGVIKDAAAFPGSTGFLVLNLNSFNISFKNSVFPFSMSIDSSNRPNGSIFLVNLSLLPSC